MPAVEDQLTAAPLHMVVVVVVVVVMRTICLVRLGHVVGVGVWKRVVAPAPHHRARKPRKRRCGACELRSKKRRHVRRGWMTT